MNKMKTEFIELPRAIFKSLMLRDKEVKVSGTSGAIYVPKELVGKKFTIWMIEKEEGLPIDSPDTIPTVEEIKQVI